MVQAIEPGSYPRPWDPDRPAAEQEGDPPNVWVVLGDKRWPFWGDETTAAQARKVRDQTGHTRGYWLQDVVETDGREIDSWTVLWWMARMQCGEPDLTLAACEAGLKFGDDFRVEADAAVIAAATPEATTEPEPAADAEPEDESPEA